MWLDVPMNEVSIPQEFHSTRQLFEEMSNNDLVQASVKRVGVFADHVSQRRVIAQLISLLDEVRQIPKLTVLHHQVYMSIRFAAVDQGYDVGVVESFEDFNLAVEVVFEFAVELGEVDRLDRYEGSG